MSFKTKGPMDTLMTLYLLFKNLDRVIMHLFTKFEYFWRKFTIDIIRCTPGKPKEPKETHKIPQGYPNNTLFIHYVLNKGCVCICLPNFIIW